MNVDEMQPVIKQDDEEKLKQQVQHPDQPMNTDEDGQILKTE